MLTVIGCIGSFQLANHFADHKQELSPQITQSMRWIESLFLDNKQLELQSIPNQDNKPIDLNLSTQLSSNEQESYSHMEVGRLPVCVDTSLGEVKYKKVGNIYTWTDENDVYHVSDKAPIDRDFEIFDYAGEKVFDYFNLNLNTESLPYDFNQKLTVKLNKLFELYGKLLDRGALKKVDINLRVIHSNIAYQQIKKQHNMSVGNKSNGFYSHSNNQAYLLFIDNEQTMKTAAHEATHAINRAIIGYTPRWLNEGLAEYSENINVIGNSASVYPDQSWTKKGYISTPLLPLSTLFSVKNSDWDSKIRQQLYATSWAFTFFIMGHPHRKSILARLIKSEQQNLCNTIDKDNIEQQLDIPLNMLQKQFTNWSKLKVRRQSI